MESDWVVEALYVLEDGDPRLLLRLEACAIGTLLAQGGKEGLPCRVLVPIAGATHAHLDIQLREQSRFFQAEEPLSETSSAWHPMVIEYCWLCSALN